MKSKFILFIITLVSSLSSCGIYPYPIEKEPSVRIYKPNKEWHNVTFLFEHDGCQVYRFYDMGNYIYFTNCQGNVIKLPKDSTENVITNNINVTYDKIPVAPEKVN